MTLPGFSALVNAWWFLLLVPLIIFYFLKLRRPRVDMPSLALWRQVISDQRVNSPFQKFKRNLLLLLQILLLCCLVLGAMQPYLSSGAQRAQYLPVLIDTSASMAALDVAGGKSRLDEAKEKVGKLIDDLLPDQRLCLIAVHSTARKLTDFTDNKRLLRDALAQLEVQHVSSRLEDGFQLAQALSRAFPIDSVMLISDGNVPADIEFELPFKLNYQRLNVGGPNIGIVDFNARRSKSGWDVFARIEGTKDAKTLAEYELFQNGQSLKSDSVSIEGTKAERLVFRVSTEIAVSLELKVKPDGFDSLATDNVTYLDLPKPRPLAVYCPTQMESFRNALDTIPDLNLYPSGDPTPAAVDLKFVDGPIASGPEARVLFNVGYVPDDIASLVEVEAGLAEIVDWQRTAPLLQHVQMLDVQIGDQPKLAKGVGERDFELAGYEILAQSRTGPLILEKPNATGTEFQFLFHPDRSSLVYRVGFPILIQNATQVALQRAALSEAKATPTGSLPTLKLQPETDFTVTGPQGFTQTAKSDANGLLSGIEAPFVGAYEVTGGPEPVRVGASLIASRESSMESVEKLNFPEVSVSASETAVKSDQPLWGWLAAAGLTLLAIEWWYFQKKPSGVPG
ncbi:MAG: BatA and WFA domain-containing protein [Planctomycetota bacterium]